MLHFDILTLFPGMFAGPFEESIIKRARERGLISIALHDIRAHATDRHRMTDDTPYGGGGGMVMKPEPIFRAVESVLGIEARGTEPPPPASPTGREPPIILLTPQGRLFTQRAAEKLAGQSRLLLICGRYEGVDERVREHLVNDEISIGDYVLSGGEVPAMVIVDAVTRLLPGALGDEQGATQDSHASGLLEHPHYTRPVEFRGWRVPEILLSGHHANVARWRREQSLRRTLERRPDMLRTALLAEADRAFLRSQGWEENGV